MEQLFNNTKHPARTGAATEVRSATAVQDNRQKMPLQRSVIPDFRGAQRSKTGEAKGVLQAKWKDKDGNEHEGDPPKGWQSASNTVIGDHWVPPTVPSKKKEPVSDGPEKEEKKVVEKKLESSDSEDNISDSEESTSESEGSASDNGSEADEGGYEGGSDEEFEFDEDEHQQLLNDPDEKVRGKSGEYRSSRRFYDDKRRRTRKNLEKRQSRGGVLYSRSDGSGKAITRDSGGREKRKHKTPKAKDRQPDIDHKIDWVILDDAIDKYENEQSSMSEAELETFKDEVYNYEPNLEILSHEDHSGKTRTTRDKITDNQRKKGFNFVKERRQEFKKSNEAQDRRNEKRERLKKKRKRGDTQKGLPPTKKKKKGSDDDDTE